jgi:hypothetical protein
MFHLGNVAHRVQAILFCRTFAGGSKSRLLAPEFLSDPERIGYTSD